MNWLISANGKIYNHNQAFKKWGYIDWKQIGRYEIGDIVYIYCTIPVQKIIYKCEVIKNNMTYDQCEDDREFWYDIKNYESSKDGLYARLKLLEDVDTEYLGIERLKQNGLKAAPQRPIKISDELSNYINKYFNSGYDIMTKKRILYCRIGYMKNYNGIIDDIGPKGGGAYNKENIGHEIYNFSESDGRFYGYVQPPSNSINIKRIDYRISDNDEKIEDVLVVWVATKDNFGQCIVGWYENATVYKNLKYITENIINQRFKCEASNYNEYYITSEKATLVLEDRRNERISGMGQANIWFGNLETNERVLNYIEHYNNIINTNVATISDFKELDGKDKDAIVKVRENQGYFRKRLLERYNGCCLCHLSNKKLLIASHIKPWAQSNPSEKLNKYNGLLLCPNHDKVFDGGLISFEDNGTIIISERLTSIDRVLLNLSKEMKIEVDSNNMNFIKYHRENIFDKA